MGGDRGKYGEMDGHTEAAKTTQSYFLGPKSIEILLKNYVDKVQTVNEQTNKC